MLKNLVPRLYQQTIFSTAAAKNTLVVLPTGLGKCLGKNSLFLQDNGNLIKIGEYFEEALKQGRIIKNDPAHIVVAPSARTRVLSLNEKSLKFEGDEIVAAHKIKAKELLKITTKSGAELIVTPEHPLLTLNDSLEWKRADCFKVNEFIATPRQTEIDTPSNAELNLFEIFNKKLSNRRCWVKFEKKGNRKEMPLDEAIKIGIKKEEILGFFFKGGKTVQIMMKPMWNISKDLLYFVGLVLAEGRISGGVKFYNTNQTLLEKFSALSKSLFGLIPEPIKDGLLLRSTALVYFLKEAFELAPCQHSRNKTVHEKILSASKEEIASFISALFDGEGSVRRDGLIEFSTASRAVATHAKDGRAWQTDWRHFARHQ